MKNLICLLYGPKGLQPVEPENSKGNNIYQMRTSTTTGNKKGRRERMLLDNFIKEKKQLIEKFSKL